MRYSSLTIGCGRAGGHDLRHGTGVRRTEVRDNEIGVNARNRYRTVDDRIPTLPRPAQADSAAPHWFYFAVTFAILLGLIQLGRDFLVPLVVATLLFILALAITERIGSLSIGGWKPPRWFARLLGVAFVLLMFLAIGTIAAGQAQAIARAAPYYTERF